MKALFVVRGVVLALIAASVMWGCPSKPAGSGEVGMRIEVLGFEGCPNTPELLARVRKAARGMDGVRIEYVDQMRLAANDLRRGYPAPTVLVNGSDLFGLPTPTTTDLACRAYVGGLPDIEEISARLASHAQR